MQLPHDRNGAAVRRRVPRQRIPRLRVLRRPLPADSDNDLATLTPVPDEATQSEATPEKDGVTPDKGEVTPDTDDVASDTGGATPDTGEAEARPDKTASDTAEPVSAEEHTDRPEPVAVTPAAGKSPVWLVLNLVFAVMLVGALLAAAYPGYRWYERRQMDDAHRAAVAAARQAAVDFVSISADSVDADLQRISAAATGDFADEFKRGMSQVRTAVVENDVESQGKVLRAGLVSGDLDSAVVIVAVDATVKNKGAPKGRLSHYRIQMDMVRDHESGQWLVGRLQFVG